jgi:hypothetical protein
MNMRILAVVLALGALFSPLAAQGSSEAWLLPFAAAYQPSVSAFNAAFAAAGLPGARARHYGWGIELRSLVSGVLIGPMYFHTGDAVAGDSFSLSTASDGILGTVGIKIAPFSFLAIVPQLGVGGINQSYTICQRSGDVALPDLLGDPGRSAVLSPGMKLGGLGALELDLSATVASGTYGLSLRGGYLYSPFRLDWRLNGGSSITGVPDTKLGGPFFSAGIVIMPAPEVQTTGGFQ